MGFLYAQYLKRFLIAMLALAGGGLVNVHAGTHTLSDTQTVLHRMSGWENPVTGNIVFLPEGYDYSTNIPGLSWKIIHFVGENKDSVDSGRPADFKFFIMKSPRMFDVSNEDFEEYDLKPDGSRKRICGQEILRGTAVDRKGKLYAFDQLEAVFGEEHKQYSVLFIYDSTRKKTLLDEKVFCSIVQSFYAEEDNSHTLLYHEYRQNNPLSGKLITDPEIKIKVEEIISHRLGSHQIYNVTKGKLRAELIKVHNNPYVFDFFQLLEVEKMSLLDGTDFHWETRISGLDRNKKYESLRLKGQFTQITEKGEKRSGIVHHGYSGGEDWIFVKVWRQDAKALDAAEQNWAQELFNNSILDKKKN